MLVLLLRLLVKFMLFARTVFKYHGGLSIREVKPVSKKEIKYIFIYIVTIRGGPEEKTKLRIGFSRSRGGFVFCVIHCAVLLRRRGGQYK